MRLLMHLESINAGQDQFPSVNLDQYGHQDQPLYHEYYQHELFSYAQKPLQFLNSYIRCCHSRYRNQFICCDSRYFNNFRNKSRIRRHIRPKSEKDEPIPLGLSFATYISGTTGFLPRSTFSIGYLGKIQRQPVTS